MDNKISVIIPVYQVAKFLPRCIESVRNQDHNNLEIILIDDGSTDGSGAICDYYAAEDSRIRVIHQENAGAAAAKNAGLKIATGEYLSFVDSDDFLEPNVYGYMLEVLQSEHADAAQFGFREVYTNRTEDQVHGEGRKKLDGKEYLCQFTKDWTCALLWNKLYRRSLYDGIYFEEGHKVDDEYFTYQGFLKKVTVVCDDRIIYNYRKRASSVMSAPESAELRVLDCLDAVVKRRRNVLSVYPDLRRIFDENYLDTIWYLSENPACTERAILELKAHLKDYFCTWGNSFPPRYLWPLLWKVFWTSTEALVTFCKSKQDGFVMDEYF